MVANLKQVTERLKGGEVFFWHIKIRKLVQEELTRGKNHTQKSLH